MVSSKGIEGYILSFPKKTQIVLRKMQAILRAVVPQAEETITYGIPTLKIEGKNLVHFGAFKKHVGFYPTPTGISKFKTELLKYETAKGSVKFPLEQPIPYGLIKRIVKFRLGEIEQARNQNSQKMQTFDSFSDWEKQQISAHKKIIIQIRNLINEVAPQLTESCKWGNGVWLSGKLPLVYIHSKRDHLQLGFFAGALLKDSYGILQGKGKYVRYVPIQKVSDLEFDKIAELVNLAVKAPPYK